MHSGHNAAKTVTHMGFSEEEVKKIFENAGVEGDFKYLKVGKGKITFGDGRRVFLGSSNESDAGHEKQ